MPSEKQTPVACRPALARYANYFEIGHNPFEFLIDFGQFQPESASVMLHTRIVFGPAHAKLLEHMLGEAVQRYESENSVIPDVSEKPDLTNALADLKHANLRENHDPHADSGSKSNKSPPRKKSGKRS